MDMEFDLLTPDEVLSEAKRKKAIPAAMLHSAVQGW
jgi:hypothetical protein